MLPASSGFGTFIKLPSLTIPQAKKLILHASFLRVLLERAHHRMQDPEGQAQQLVARPLCVALIDFTGTEEYLELVRCSLLAALEALPPCTEFGLATFSDKVNSMCHNLDVYQRF